jgi:hypothetical protein
MDGAEAIALVFGSAVFGGVIVVIAGMWHRARVLEMAHRERLAMIERGMVPPSDLMQAYREQPTARGRRLLSAGIVVVGMGLAIGLLLAFTSREGAIAMGIGGSIVVLGATFIATGLAVRSLSGPETAAIQRSTPWIDRPPSPPPHNPQ